MIQEGTTIAAMPADRIIVNLNSLLLNVLQPREALQTKRNIGLNLDLAENLPDVSVNPEQMQQVLLKLVQNAEDAFAGRREGTIHVKTAVERKRIHVTVTDNGRGLRAREMERLFENEGTRVDLTACAELVRDHGGELYAWSRYEQGSIFTMELPFQAVAPSHQPLRGKRVLLIDDEVQICGLMADVLKTQGATIDVVHSGMKAIERVEKAQYDLLICDQHMPGMSGEQVYSWIQSEKPELQDRFLFVTGDVLNDETVHFFVQNGVRYIQKPFRMGELVMVVERVLSRNQQLSF